MAVKNHRPLIQHFKLKNLNHSLIKAYPSLRLILEAADRKAERLSEAEAGHTKVARAQVVENSSSSTCGRRRPPEAERRTTEERAIVTSGACYEPGEPASVGLPCALATQFIAGCALVVGTK